MKHQNSTLILPLTLLFATLTTPTSYASPVILLEDADNISSSLTIYNNGQGLIRQSTEIDLPLGQSELSLVDISNRAIPTSILFRELTNINTINLLEQSYHAPQLSRDQLLARNIGQPIQFTTQILVDNTTVPHVRTGTLLSTQGDTIVAFDEGIEINPEGVMSFSSLPDDLSPNPILSWQLDNTEAGLHTIEVSYLSYGLNWDANYVSLLNSDNTELELTAWVTLTNNSNMDFEDTAIKLVAGQLNLAPVYQPNRPLMMQDVPEQTSFVPFDAKIDTQSLSIYQLYTLDQPTSLQPFATKQVKLFKKEGVSVKPNYTLTSFIQDTTRTNPRHLTTEIQFDNTQINQLAIPMPAGTMSFYQADEDDLLQLVGQDTLAHTPINEGLKLNIGEAFDVVADHNQTEFKQINEDTAEASYRIEVRNHQDTMINATINEQLPSQIDWVVIDENISSEQPDANTLQYTIEVPPNGNIQIDYTIQMKINTQN